MKKKDLYDSTKVLDSTDVFIEYIEALNKIKSTEALVYFMLEIVAKELLVQKEFTFNETYKCFEKKYKENSYGLVGELPKNNIKAKLEQEESEYSDKYNLIERRIVYG